MTALLFTVATGVLGTLAGWVAVRVLRVWRRLRLRRLVYGQRRSSRRLLQGRLTPGGGRAMGRRQVHLLARSFRVKMESRLDVPHLAEREIVDASSFLDHVEEQRGDLVYLVNADSGYGKTVFGLTMPLLRSVFSRKSLFPCYIDLAVADGEQPLALLDELLDRLGGTEDLWGCPLVVFDAPNETVDPEYFGEALAARRKDLEAVGAHLLFLFSFRHHSYPGRLRSALMDNGFNPLQGMELLFEVEEGSDLTFFPHLVRLNGGPLVSREEVGNALRNYAARFPSPPLSREDAAAYLEWRYCSDGQAREASAAPSPASLCLGKVLGQGDPSANRLFPLARVAFSLLEREVTAATYRYIHERLGVSEGELRHSVAHCGLAGTVHCGSHHLRFEDETTVRVFGAIEVARRLAEGESPQVLRGRTTFDVCAPYVPPALAWLDREGTQKIAVGRAVGGVRAALCGSDAPYSFYAGVLSGGDAEVFGEGAKELDALLLHEMIAAIDEDRGQTCRDSLHTAGGGESEMVLDPVLDQLFEVMAVYGRRAAGLLLPLLDDLEPLIRSQAAYLLLDWIDAVAACPSADDVGVLRSIPAGMRGDDDNLHFRFHEVEVLERLLALFPASDGPRAEVVSKLTEISMTRGATSEVESYGSFQRLVGLWARHLAEGLPESLAGTQLYGDLRECLAVLERDSTFAGRGPESIGEVHLECWEVALGMATRTSASVSRNTEFVAFIEAALDHDYWIVRWWAFGGLIGVLRAAAGNGARVLSVRCARRAVHQLYTGVEPMGLKHRQCALIKRLREENDPAGRLIRAALSEARPPRLATPEGQALAECYYEMMGASPDAYLAEFSRRLDGLAVHPI